MTLPKHISDEFDKKFSVLKYEQNGEQHEGFRVSKVPNSKDIKQWFATTLETEVQKAVEANDESWKATNELLTDCLFSRELREAVKKSIPKERQKQIIDSLSHNKEE